MAKKEITPITPTLPAQEYNPEAIYTSEERQELETLMRTVINDWGKLEHFYTLYKKYVDPSAPRPVGGCGNCALSIETYFTRFREWFLENHYLFS